MITTMPTGSPVVTACKTDLTGDLKKLKVRGLSAAIVKNGRLVCTAVAGMAGRNQPVTPNTLFLWASVSKTVTATALMQLYDQGKIQLDDDINKYLPFQVSIPSCPNTPVTFRQLLTHTSSIKDNNKVIDSMVTQGDPTVSLADFVKGYLTPGGQYYDRNANFEAGCPGTINDYSNMGATTIGYLVETISGTNFYQYTKDNIFTPLGMTEASFRLADLNQLQIALPKGKGSQYGEANFPDGMLRTSPSHLAKFLIAYMQGGSV